jgi:ankyrin repeat protein
MNIRYFEDVPIPFEAIRRGESDIVRHILLHDEASVQPDYIHPKTGVSLLNLAIVKEISIDVLQLLFEKMVGRLDGKDVNGNTALHTACVIRRSDIVAILLNNGANPNVTNKANIAFVVILMVSVMIMNEHLTFCFQSQADFDRSTAQGPQNAPFAP